MGEMKDQVHDFWDAASCGEELLPETLDRAGYAKQAAKRYELEPYLLFQAIRGRYRIKEAPVTVRYHGRGTTKMRLIQDGWRILRPLVFLRLGMRH